MVLISSITAAAAAASNTESAASTTSADDKLCPTSSSKCRVATPARLRLTIADDHHDEMAFSTAVTAKTPPPRKTFLVSPCSGYSLRQDSKWHFSTSRMPVILTAEKSRCDSSIITP